MPHRETPGKPMPPTGVTDVAVRPAADAFLQVGVWVAVMLFAFALVQWRTGGRVERFLADKRGLGPLAGALLGVTPGCGGAILVMPLYTRGTVSFGTVVATLVATMGDSSFVLIVAAPRTAVAVHGLLLATGLVTGYLVDLSGYEPKVARGGPSRLPRRPSTVGAAAAEIDLTGRLAYRFPSPAMLGFWGLVAAGLVLSLLVVFQLVSEEALAARTAGVNLYLVGGVLGTAACAAILARNGGRVEAPADGACATHDSLREALRHAARETAFVTAWVAAAFYAYAWFEAATGLDAARLPAVGIVGVVVGALVGLVPGCGPQILLTGLYAQGALPLSTLVANALSQDGDALFPLLVRDRRSAMRATLVTTAPALVVGGALLLAGL